MAEDPAVKPKVEGVLDARVAVLAALRTAEALKRLKELVDALYQTEVELSSAQRMVVSLEQALADRELELHLDSGVSEGKNEKERQGRLVGLRRADSAYIGLAKDLDLVRNKVDTAGAAGSRLRREWGYLSVFLRLRTAQISFLGGSDDTGEA